MLSKGDFYLFWGDNEADYVLKCEPDNKGGFCHLEEVALLMLALIVCMLPPQIRFLNKSKPVAVCVVGKPGKEVLWRG